LALSVFSGKVKTMSVDEFRPLGGHEVKIERDLVFLRIKGVVTLADMMKFLQVQAEVKREHGAVYVLYDSRENTGLDPAARKYATEQGSDEYRVNAAASFGAPFTMRIVVNMLNRAHDMLRREGARVQLFDTEAEARKYLADHRLQSRPVAAA
jgi:SpoIIAA-like